MPGWFAIETWAALSLIKVCMISIHIHPPDISSCDKIPPNVVQITARPNDGGPTCPLNGGQMSPDVRARRRSSMMLLLQMQSCKMSYLLHRANHSNQILPHEKCVNCDKLNT